MRKDKDKIIELRKTGKSYKEIEQVMGVPRSTLSAWFKGQAWSSDLVVSLRNKVRSDHIVRLQSLDKIRGLHLDRLYKQAEFEAVQEFDQIKNHPLFISALMIYWGEGDKASPYRCSIANTEPAMIKIFLLFLENICCMPRTKIKSWILLYPDLNEEECKKYWIEKSGLEYSDFNKSIVIQGRHKTNRVRYGVCNLGVSSAYLKRKILIWIDLLAKDIVKEEIENKKMRV
ncbi:MAG: hypothetical protein WCW14_01690 [Candidatus Paceibacterota bacterium]|jgi:hypothetical protein